MQPNLKFVVTRYDADLGLHPATSDALSQFADLSEYGYGVAFLSESKYGYACEGNVLRLSLLRAATAPDAEQDQGTQCFTSSSHAGTAHISHI